MNNFHTSMPRQGQITPLSCERPQTPRPLILILDFRFPCIEDGIVEILSNADMFNQDTEVFTRIINALQVLDNAELELDYALMDYLCGFTLLHNRAIVAQVLSIYKKAGIRIRNELLLHGCYKNNFLGFSFYERPDENTLMLVKDDNLDAQH
jgi:hypothetical protein